MTVQKSDNSKKTDFDTVRRKLKLKSLREQADIEEIHTHIKDILKDKMFIPGKIRETSAHLLNAGIVTGSVILGLPQSKYHLPAPHELIEYVRSFKENRIEIDKKHSEISKILLSILPNRPRSLTRNEEKLIENVLSDYLGINVRATLEGEHLNTTYGYVGLEQHLRRYPGDSMSQHTQGFVQKAGMAPGLGAWGYFAYSRDDLTDNLREIEKWYAVVQTLYLPDWNTRQPYLKDWYKYRKVVMVNPDNGKVVVGSIADSGPAAWTGKQFGASPETMLYLGGERYTKGDIIVFFVDDPENNVPLGPVEYGQVDPDLK
ncbi:hypothetical protein JXA63_02210 [Candidatus Woesebacteria bacterium]|nr:hypothetical protein [Candidatus Woesebacteria bacterium]